MTHKNGQKLAKFRNLTLKNDLLTLKVTSGDVENDTSNSLSSKPLYGSQDHISSPSRSQYSPGITEIQNFDLEIWPIWPWRWPQMLLRMALLNSPSSKTPIYVLRSYLYPFRSHFCPGLKLILQTQVTNPKVVMYQSFSKVVCGCYLAVNDQELNPWPLNCASNTLTITPPSNVCNGNLCNADFCSFSSVDVINTVLSLFSSVCSWSPSIYLASYRGTSLAMETV